MNEHINCQHAILKMSVHRINEWFDCVEENIDLPTATLM